MGVLGEVGAQLHPLVSHLKNMGNLAESKTPEPVLTEVGGRRDRFGLDWVGAESGQ